MVGTLKRPGLWLGLVMMVGAGCGGGRPASVELAVEKLVSAARGGDAEAFRAAFPSPDEVAELFACPAGMDLAKRFEGLSGDFEGMREAPAKVVSVVVGQRDDVAPGGAVGECKAKRGLALVKATVEVEHGARKDSYAMRFVVVDGGVAVLGF
jgi:hypothetical protein